MSLPQDLCAARPQRDHGKLDVTGQRGTEPRERGDRAGREGGVGDRCGARGGGGYGGSAGFFFIHRLSAGLNARACGWQRGRRRDLRSDLASRDHSHDLDVPSRGKDKEHEPQYAQCYDNRAQEKPAASADSDPLLRTGCVGG